MAVYVVPCNCTVAPSGYYRLRAIGMGGFALLEGLYFENENYNNRRGRAGWPEPRRQAERASVL